MPKKKEKRQNYCERASGWQISSRASEMRRFVSPCHNSFGGWKQRVVWTNSSTEMIKLEAITKQNKWALAESSPCQASRADLRPHARSPKAQLRLGDETAFAQQKDKKIIAIKNEIATGMKLRNKLRFYCLRWLTFISFFGRMSLILYRVFIPFDILVKHH